MSIFRKISTRLEHFLISFGLPLRTTIKNKAKVAILKKSAQSLMMKIPRKISTRINNFL